jgi:hypothetical protein
MFDVRGALCEAVHFRLAVCCAAFADSHNLFFISFFTCKRNSLQTANCELQIDFPMAYSLLPSYVFDLLPDGRQVFG